MHDNLTPSAALVGLVITLALGAVECSNPAKASAPVRALTPGSTFPLVPLEALCKPGFSERMRNVSKARKRRVCALYGAAECPGPKWEVDHLVPLELGGSNDDRNLWPQPKADARRKDKVENALRRAVCAGKRTLVGAQLEMEAWSTP